MSIIRYVTCKRCARHFAAPRSDACYCSPACRQAAHRVRADKQRNRLKAKTAARREREAAVRAKTAAAEARARANIARPWTPEEIARLRWQENAANLSLWIKECNKAIQRGREAMAAKNEFQAKLAQLEATGAQLARKDRA